MPVNDQIIFVFLILCILILMGITFYQQWVFRFRTQKQLREISRKLSEITCTDSDQQVLLFTDNREMMELAAQINALLTQYQKVKLQYRRSEISSKKMLSNISHDIKTPMTVILGYLEIMELNKTCSDDMLKKIQKQAKDLMELINQFFILAKLESGDIRPELSRIDLCEVCRESILDFYELLTKEEIQVDIGLPDGPVYVQASREALQRILMNLISNVIRYGADGRYLGVSLRKDQSSVYLEVSDKGQGIEKPFADRIFDRLYTLEDSGSKKVQGNGLGLTIVRHLAEQLGGSVAVESTPNARTTFTVKLRKSSS